MYFVYFLFSTVNNDLYVGSIEDVDRRLHLHSQGRVKSTKAYRPWKLLGKETYSTRSEAFQREHFLKNHQQKDIVRRKYNLI